MVYNRGTFIKDIIEEFEFKKYLEIGLSHNPIAPYRILDKVKVKHSIDTDETTGADFIMTSDNFFKSLKSGDFISKGIEKDYKWDLIFIDGNHYATQVYADLINAHDHLSDNGVIVMHDVLPHDYYRTLEVPIPINYENKQMFIPVMQCDAWKVIHFCLKNHSNMNVCTAPENEGGLGIITKNRLNDRLLLPPEHNRFFQFTEMKNDIEINMNVVSSDQVIEWIKTPTHKHIREINE